MKEIRDIIRFWEVNRAQPLALATLVAARGSSYRRPGARMLINAAGGSAGGLSAGCIEEEVIACAQQVLATSEPRLLTFDTLLRFGCHGIIQIFVEPVSEEFMTELRDCMNQRQPCRVETVLHAENAGTRIAGFTETPGAFVQTIEPGLRLILIGDGSEIAALHAQATVLGWECLRMEGPTAAPELLDSRTAVVLATHNYGRDCAALRALLPAGLKYLGVVGSRRRRDDLLFDLLQEPVEQQSCLFAPAGLHLGADAPEEIALSIVAEIQSVFGAGTAEHLRSRKAPIHQAVPQMKACAELAP